jgi:hypothetical protein
VNLEIKSLGEISISPVGWLGVIGIGGTAFLGVLLYLLIKDE